jgi:catechol 2,3-dioxygenase-like lactoylglutathione lyase family enzyme
MNPFEASELTTILVVSDIEASKKFYMDALGGSLYREYGGTSAVIQLFGNWLLLSLPGDPTADKPNTYFVTPSDQDRVSHAYTIRVKDCQSAYDHLTSHGVEFITPPYNWGGEIRCFFRDPDGHLFEISEIPQV